MPMARKVEHMYHLVEQYCIKIFGGTFTQLHELDKKDFAKKMMAILLLDLRFSVFEELRKDLSNEVDLLCSIKNNTNKENLKRFMK